LILVKGAAAGPGHSSVIAEGAIMTSAGAGERGRAQESVREVRVGSLALAGDLIVPNDGSALIVFAHGSGSSRMSPRNRAVARALNRRGLATLLFDLLRPDEERDRAKVFDIPLLAERLIEAVQWLGRQPDLASLPIGLFGASTGAAAALVAAAELGNRVGAVVSRGGRPDLAASALDRVTAPTLLIVGGFDDVVIELNEQAFARLTCAKALEIVPGATHLFPEPGALERVIELAGDWFGRHLKQRRAQG
jgi:pimeloyl-ACP methyl ester carboxylesterase